MTTLAHADLALCHSILARANDLTLAAIRPDGRPHASTVSFAADGLVLFAAIGIDCQKAHDIGADPHVALTVNAPYADWNEIQGLVIEGTALIVTDANEMAHASRLLLARHPQFAKFMSNTRSIPWAGTIFIKVLPVTLRLIDYRKGFGHMDKFSVASETVGAQ